MARPQIASEELIIEAMNYLPFWTREGGSIVREIVTADFVSAIGLVNSIAILAEVADHHPDIFIYGWNKLRITLSTHDQSGLTELDFELAKKIDKLKF